MAKVFISYRRADSAPSAGRIYDRLVTRFGRRNVFKDVDDIPPGVDIISYINDSLQKCVVELVVIGPQWTEAHTQQGIRRLDEPNDFVRVEIETAFALELTVIPLLVDGAKMPATEELPESIQQLARVNAIDVRNDPDFARDMERVLRALEHAFDARRTGRSSGLFGRRSTAAPRSESPAPLARTVAEDITPSKSIRRSIGFSLLPAWRPLLVGLTAVLVVALFGVLLTSGALSGTIGNNTVAQTQTALARSNQTTATADYSTVTTSQTQTAAATTSAAQTATAIVAPYFAAIPGPCGSARNDWSTTQPPLSAHTTYTCLSDSFKITIQAESSVSYAYFDGFDSPPNFRVSVDVFNLSGDVCPRIFVIGSNGGGYSFNICSNGTYRIYLIGDGNIQGKYLDQGSVSAQSMFKFEAVINGSTKQILRNGSLISSVSDATFSSWGALALGLDPRFNFTNGSVQYKNFSLTKI